MGALKGAVDMPDYEAYAAILQAVYIARQESEEA